MKEKRFLECVARMIPQSFAEIFSSKHYVSGSITVYLFVNIYFFIYFLFLLVHWLSAAATGRRYRRSFRVGVLSGVKLSPESVGSIYAIDEFRVLIYIFFYDSLDWKFEIGNRSATSSQ